MANKKLNQEEFLKRVISKHKNNLSFEKTVYKGVKEKLIVTCPIHGDYETTGRVLLKSGCKRCATKENRKKVKHENLKENFINFSNQKHNFKYDYSLVNYVNNRVKVDIICPIHGIFSQSPRNHISNKGCYKCGRNSTGKILTKTISLKELIEKSNKVHRDKYSFEYKKDEVFKINQKIEIICKEHGKFEQNIFNHLKGHGCNNCTYRGYDKESYVKYCKHKKIKNATLYLIRCYNENENFLKIGITNNEVKNRFYKKKFIKGL